MSSGCCVVYLRRRAMNRRASTVGCRSTPGRAFVPQVEDKNVYDIKYYRELRMQQTLCLLTELQSQGSVGAPVRE